MATRMQQRRGTAAQWTAANPILAAGEIGFETDTSKFKMGNGSSTWTALQYFANAAELAAIIDGAPGLLNTLNELAAAINDDPTFFTTVATNLSNHEADTTSVHGINDTSLLVTASSLATSLTNLSETLSGNLTTHEADTTSIHGISNTANLVYATDLSSHNSDTTSVHGIADTSVLATTSNISDAVAAEAIVTAGNLSSHASDTTSVHGIADTSVLATTSDISDAVAAEAIVTAGNLSSHASDTTSVHGIADTTALVTQSDLTDAIADAAVDQSALAGVGIDWNVGTEAFDIDSTVATKTYADDAVSTHNSDTTNIHGITDTANLVYTSDSRLSDERTPVALSVTTGKIADDAVTSDKIADNAISQSHLSDDSVGTNEIGGLAVTTSKIADGAVTTGKIADGAVTKSMVGLGNVDNTSDANKPVSTATQTALDAKASLAGATFTGNVEMDGNLVVDGDFTVNGTNFSASATSITIEDNLVQLAHQNAANTVDLGLVVGYNDGAVKHSGIVRDVSADKWKLFKGVTTEPTTTVDFTEGSLDALQVAALEATTLTVSTGVAFSDGTQTKEGVASRTPIVAKTDSYTLSALTERDSLIEMNKATAVTLTIPTDATLDYPIGTSIDILQTGAGQVTIAPVSGTVTVNATPGLKLRTTWSSATLFKRAANTWVVYGDLTA